MSTSSPLRFVNNGSKVDSGSDGEIEVDNVEFIKANFQNEERHGDYLVGLCTDEEVLGGDKMASCVYILRPCAAIDEVEMMEAKLVGTTAIHITGPDHDHMWLLQAEKWLNCLKEKADDNSARKLYVVLQTLVTKMLKKKGMKTTIIDFEGTGWKLSRDYFNSEAEGEEDIKKGILQRLCLPFAYKRGATKRQFQTNVIWRACIKASVLPVKPDKANSTAVKSDIADLMRGVQELEFQSSGDEEEDSPEAYLRMRMEKMCAAALERKAAEILRESKPNECKKDTAWYRSAKSQMANFIHDNEAELDALLRAEGGGEGGMKRDFKDAVLGSTGGAQDMDTSSELIADDDL